jgi:hypothetical protein
MLMSGFGLVPAVLVAQRVRNPVAKLGIVAVLAVGAAWASAALLSWRGFAVVEWVILVPAIWIGTTAWITRNPRRTAT